MEEVSNGRSPSGRATAAEPVVSALRDGIPSVGHMGVTGSSMPLTAAQKRAFWSTYVRAARSGSIMAIASTLTPMLATLGRRWVANYTSTRRRMTLSARFSSPMRRIPRALISTATPTLLRPATFWSPCPRSSMRSYVAGRGQQCAAPGSVNCRSFLYGPMGQLPLNGPRKRWMREAPRLQARPVRATARSRSDAPEYQHLAGRE